MPRMQDNSDKGSRNKWQRMAKDEQRAWSPLNRVEKRQRSRSGWFGNLFLTLSLDAARSIIRLHPCMSRERKRVWEHLEHMHDDARFRSISCATVGNRRSGSSSACAQTSFYRECRQRKRNFEFLSVPTTNTFLRTLFHRFSAHTEDPRCGPCLFSPPSPQIYLTLVQALSLGRTTILS
jgi:hypothetical protein